MKGRICKTEQEDKAILKEGYEDKVNTALNSALRTLSARTHSEFELQQKLSRKGYESEVVAEVLKRIKEYGYLDDYLFAKSLISSELNKGSGKKIVEYKLSEKGVSLDIIEELLHSDEFSDEKFHNSQVSVLSKKLRNLIPFDRRAVVGDDDYLIKIRQKLLRFGAAKGISYELVLQVFEHFISSEVD